MLALCMCNKPAEHIRFVMQLKRFIFRLKVSDAIFRHNCYGVVRFYTFFFTGISPQNTDMVTGNGKDKISDKSGATSVQHTSCKLLLSILLYNQSGNP